VLAHERRDAILRGAGGPSALREAGVEVITVEPLPLGALRPAG
jgi:hypothetical protein